MSTKLAAGFPRRSKRLHSCPSRLVAPIFRANLLGEAEREYRAAIRAEPASGDAHNNLAVIEMLTGRYTDARRDLEAAEKAGVTVDPRFKRDLAEKAGG
jgi:hypothetical protein